MFVPGVATGVVKLEGSSEVKMVAVEGDKVYRVANVASKLAEKPRRDVNELTDQKTERTNL